MFLATSVFSQELYQVIGTDHSWKYIIDNKLIPQNINSTQGLTGSKVVVNQQIMSKLTYAKYSITNKIRIHTPGNSQISRPDFDKWSRWYQEDGNTQVFRLFQGEYNVRNTRSASARTEAFSDFSWKKGAWQEWVGSYTIVNPKGCVGPHFCSLLQVKAPDVDWGVMIRLDQNGDVIIDHRRSGQSKTVLKDMTGKSFDLRVRDNGNNYEVYFNGNLEGTGNYDRGSRESSFRWGLYMGASIPKEEILVFVTGATVNPSNSAVPYSLSLHPFGGINPSSEYSIASSPDGVHFSAKKYPVDISLRNIHGREIWKKRNVTSTERIFAGRLPPGLIYGIITSQGRNSEVIPISWTK